MAPFSIPAPCIIPLRLPVFGGPKSIDTNTKIQLLCETYLEHEMFYTLDGTKPQPYAGIVQGSKLIKYSSPFCLPPGKITVKAIAINANIHTMCSNVVTKRFEVLKAEPTECIKKSAKVKKSKNSRFQKKQNVNHKDSFEEISDIQMKESCASPNEEKFNESNEIDLNSFEEDVDCLEFENFSHEENVEDQDFPVVTQSNEISENDYISEESESEHNADDNNEKESPTHSHEIIEESFENEEEPVVVPPETVLLSSLSANTTQFCCLKCDMTLQQCFTCKRMNAVSSKFCIDCGTKLSQVCFGCKEHNPSVATFCQYCGKKLDASVNGQLETCLKIDRSVLAKPQLKNASLQKFSDLSNKYTQTVKDKSPIKKSSSKFDLKPLPRQSPGRGYWHQQLDYICNHLKSHAYNNLDFRQSISEPVLCDFRSADIAKDEDSVTVTIIFTPLVIDKSGLSGSEGMKD